jgi:hypothetical protein
MVSNWRQDTRATARVPAGLVIDRRRFMKTAGAGFLALATAGSITSCAAAAFSPAVTGWLNQLALAVGAAEIEKVIEGGLARAWHAWQAGVKKSVASQPSPYIHCNPTGWVHPVPPVVLVGVSKGAQADPMTDRLIACVHDGRRAVVFEPWAWQTLFMFVHSLTDGKSGDDLAQTRELCALTVLPSGVRPHSGQSTAGTVGWLTYQSRNGYVEIARAPGSDNSWNGSITVSAMPDAYGNPTSRVFRPSDMPYVADDQLIIQPGGGRPARCEDAP